MKISIKILLLIAICFSISACKYSKKQTGVYVYSFEKTAPISIDDSKKMISEYLNISTVHDLTVSKDENVAYFVADEDINTTFEQNLSNGNFAFSKLTSAYLNGTAPDLPSEGEAIRIAENYLASKGLSPKNRAEMRLVHSGGLRSQAVVNGAHGGPVVDLLRTLTYGRILDSMPVIGVGSKIIVNIGDKGEVYGVTRNWRELNASTKKEVKLQEMISNKEAEEMARKQIMEEFGKETRFEIRGVQKSYYDGNGNMLQPVWAFDTQLYLTGISGNRQPVSYLCIIPMLKNSPEPIHLTTIDPKSKDLIKEINDKTHIVPANPDEIKEKE
jgi:hypothetical protein